jgi:hypothetical protein
VRRRVIAQEFMAIDGFAAWPNHELDFSTESRAGADSTQGPFVRPGAKSP